MSRHINSMLDALRLLGSGAFILVLAAVLALPLLPASRDAGRVALAAEPLGAECAPGVEFLGYSDALNKTALGGFAVGELSGIAYDRSSGAYFAVADRAGSVSTHMFTISIPVEDQALGTPVITAATTLTGPSGSVLNGTNFDAEGIVLTKGDELLVASESGSGAGQQPEVTAFTVDGQYIADLPVPARFLIGPNNLSFESLAMSPNGHSLFTAVEGPLAADGRTADLRSRLRILRWENRGPDGYVPAEQFFYLTEPGRTTADLGLAEIIALSETDLLVLERGFVSGLGNTIRIFHVSLRVTPEVSGVTSLAALGADEHSAALAAKTLLVDVANCPSSGATNPPGDPANPLLENFEAMTLGPRINDGWRSLILVSDDNLAGNQTTRVVALAVRESMLAGQDDLQDPSQ